MAEDNENIPESASDDEIESVFVHFGKDEQTQEAIRAIVASMNRRLADKVDIIREENLSQHSEIIKDFELMQKEVAALKAILEPFTDVIKMGEGFQATTKTMGRLRRLWKPIGLFSFALILLFSDLVHWVRQIGLWLKHIALLITGH